MEEAVLLQLMITMRSGRVVQLLVSDTELGWLYDKMFGREVGRFQNFENMVVCIDDIEYLEWDEVEELTDDGDALAAWENTANPLVINAETIQSRLHDCQQAYQEAAQLRSEAKTMTELVFILDRLLAILGRILGR